MTTITIEIDASDLERVLEELPGALNEMLPMAMTIASGLLVEEAKRLAPSRTNALAQSIQSMPVSGSFLTNDLAGGVTALAPHAFAVEKGAKPHDIVPKVNRTTFDTNSGYEIWKTPYPKRRMRFPGRGGPGGWTYAKHISHPGNASQPFMAPAFEAKRSEVVAQFEKAADLAVKTVSAKGRSR